MNHTCMRCGEDLSIDEIDKGKCCPNCGYNIFITENSIVEVL